MVSTQTIGKTVAGVVIASTVMALIIHMFVLQTCPQRIEFNHSTETLKLYHSFELFTCTEHQQQTRSVMQQYNQHVKDGYDMNPEDAYVMYMRQVQNKTEQYGDPMDDYRLSPIGIPNRS